MTLHVDADSIISEVQEQFQSLFPDLKLEFFFTSAKNLNFTRKLHHSFPFVKICELCEMRRGKNLDIRESMTIAELEKKFRKKFGLPIHIYRRSGAYWMKKRSSDRRQLKDA